MSSRHGRKSTKDGGGGTIALIYYYGSKFYQGMNVPTLGTSRYTYY
jgi:hypothetical protein